MASKTDITKLAARLRNLHWQGRIAEAEMNHWLEVAKREDELSAEELIEAQQKATEAEITTVEVKTRMAGIREAAELLGVAEAVEAELRARLAED